MKSSGFFEGNIDVWQIIGRFKGIITGVMPQPKFTKKNRQFRAWVYRLSSKAIQQVQLSPHPVSLDQACSLLPPGVYTTLCTYRGKFLLRLEDHLRRLVESASLEGVSISLSDLAARQMILEALVSYTPLEIRFRLLVDLNRSVGDFYLVAEPFRPSPKKIYQHGVSVVTDFGARGNPRAKHTSYITKGMELRALHSEAAYEVILTDEEGNLLEGSSSNFYGVINGEIFTANENILFGITRSLVLDEARLAGISIQYLSINKLDLARVDEAFITSSTRGILPVKCIDGISIGKTVPGPITKELMKRYAARLDQELEPVSSQGFDSSSSGPARVESSGSTSSPRS